MGCTFTKSGTLTLEDSASIIVEQNQVHHEQQEQENQEPLSNEILTTNTIKENKEFKNNVHSNSNNNSGSSTKRLSFVVESPDQLFVHNNNHSKHKNGLPNSNDVDSPVGMGHDLDVVIASEQTTNQFQTRHNVNTETASLTTAQPTADLNHERCEKLAALVESNKNGKKILESLLISTIDSLVQRIRNQDINSLTHSMIELLGVSELVRTALNFSDGNSKSNDQWSGWILLHHLCSLNDDQLLRYIISSKTCNFSHFFNIKTKDLTQPQNCFQIAMECNAKNTSKGI